MFKKMLGMFGLGRKKAAVVEKAPEVAPVAVEKPKAVSATTAHSRPKKAKGAAKKVKRKVKKTATGRKKAVRPSVRRNVRKPSKRGRIT